MSKDFKLKSITLGIEVPIEIRPYQILKLSSSVTVEGEDQAVMIEQGKRVLMKALKFQGSEKTIDTVNHFAQQIKEYVKVFDGNGKK